MNKEVKNNKDEELEEALVTKEAKPTVKEKEIEIEKVGDMIRSARLKKKMEIEKVSKTLCIRKVYLEAIENSNYEALPEYPYGIGFVRSYADFLGLSGSRMADLFNLELNYKANPNKDIVAEDIDIETSMPSKQYIIISVLAVVLLYFAWLFVNKYYAEEDYETVEASSDTTTEFPLQIEDFTTQDANFSESGGSSITVIETSGQSNIDDAQITVEEGAYYNGEQESTPSVETEIPADVSVTQPKQVVQKGVEIVILDDTWFEAKDGEKLYVSKEFAPGTRYIVPDKPGVIISVGRPNAVEVYIDGKLVEGVFTPRRKTNIYLDSYLNKSEH